MTLRPENSNLAIYKMCSNLKKWVNKGLVKFLIHVRTLFDKLKKTELPTRLIGVALKGQFVAKVNNEGRLLNKLCK